MKKIIILFILLPLLNLSQEVIILDTEDNPISNVAVFNSLKTKSTLSDNNGIVNLGRFSNEDTIVFQHPNYKLQKITKSNVDRIIQLEIEHAQLEDIIISETKNSNNINNVAEKKIHITRAEISELYSATPAELLEKKGGVSVQRSQMGGGSPNIRGFEANKVLLMLDGVRLNNAIYRSGHLQNIITIDESILENIEIVFGPSSVLYGSDALGGTINMQSKDIYFITAPRWSGRGVSNYNSGSNGIKNSFSLIFESPRYSTITNFSFKRFGDLEMGSWRPHGYDDWGLVNHYIDESDSIICNPSPEIQRGTGYGQHDFFNKMIFKIYENTRITSNIQYSSSSNIPRFDKLNDGDFPCFIDTNGVCSAGENLKFHSYYYGPQERFFSSLKFTQFDYYFDKSEFILGYQKIKESRHKWYLDDFLDYLNNSNAPNNYDHPTDQYETVNVYSLNANIRKGDFYFGSETTYNDVDSETTPNDENLWGIGDTRYPPDGSSLFSTAYYINTLISVSNKLQAEGGIRYTFSHVKGSYPDNLNRPLLDIEGLNLSSKSNILSGSVKFVYYPSNKWKLSSVTARGFHSPNVDDMLKVFRKGDNITIPNINLNPEYSLSQEISITSNFSKNITIYGTGFYTQLTDAIIKDSMAVANSLTGELQYQVEYDDEYVYTFSNQNAQEKINIYGLTLGINANVQGFELNGDFNITKGINRGDLGGAIAHIPPNFGKLEVVKKLNKWKFRLLCLYSGFKPANEFDQAGIDNLDETPHVSIDLDNEPVSIGLPGWCVLNFSTQYQITKNITINLGVDNILDAHYKTFGSGLSAPGRSIITEFRCLF